MKINGTIKSILIRIAYCILAGIAGGVGGSQLI